MEELTPEEIKYRPSTVPYPEPIYPVAPEPEPAPKPAEELPSSADFIEAFSTEVLRPEPEPAPKLAVPPASLVVPLERPVAELTAEERVQARRRARKGR